MPTTLMRALLPLVITLLVGANAAQALDLHWFWDQTCRDCHGPVGVFAGQRLKVEGDKLAGKSRTGDLKSFLARHHVRDGALAERIYGMLRVQAAMAPAYQQRCAGCHAAAVDLVRGSLVAENGAILAKAAREPLPILLARHGDASPQEIATLAAALERIWSEIKGP